MRSEGFRWLDSGYKEEWGVFFQSLLDLPENCFQGNQVLRLLPHCSETLMNKCLNPCGEPWLVGRALLRVSRCIQHLRVGVLIECGRHTPRGFCMIIWTLQSSTLRADIFSVILWVTGFLRDSRGIGVNFTIHHVIVTAQEKSVIRSRRDWIHNNNRSFFRYKYANYE